jgi:GNAT superfamily N-acetyltransferase
MIGPRQSNMDAAMPTEISFRQPTPDDAARCFEIETSAYEGDEAATLEKIATRIALYPEGFVILEADGKIAGFINSGCAFEVVMSDEAFKELIGHDPAAPNAVIMSVVVDPAEQGKGYSKLLMQHFIARMKAMDKKTIHLMCKEAHVPLYARMGYRYTRPSASDHGGMAWHEMVMEL